MHLHFIQHVAFEWPGTLIDWASEKHHSISFTKIFAGDEFPSTNSFDMLIVMGGPMGVYEEEKYFWMKHEKRLLKDAINAGKKVAGICLGSQLIAEALGAKVYKHTKNEIGWFDVFKKDDHPATKNISANFRAFHWHGDTYDLPNNAVQLFSSSACNQQGYISDNRVLGLQFHPEINNELLHSMIDHERHELIKADFVQTEEEIKMMSEEYLSHQKQFIFSLMDAFTAL